MDDSTTAELKLRKLQDAIQSQIKLLELIPQDQISKQLIISNLQSILLDQEEIPKQSDPDLSLSPETTALTNHLILTEICKYLPTKELYIHRRINTHFLGVYNMTLIEPNVHSITFTFNPLSSSYENPTGTLTQLTTHLKKSSKFPCTNFTFLMGFLNSPDVSNFLSVYGKFIRKLKLQLIDDVNQTCDAVTGLRKFLLSVSSSVEYLELDDLGFQNYAEINCQLFPDHIEMIQLTKLNTFKVSYSLAQNRVLRPLVIDILRAAVNLQVTENLGGVDWLEQLVGLNKIHTLKKLSLGLNGGNVTAYEWFSSVISELKEIDFNLIRTTKSTSLWPTMAATINRLMETSQRSLEFIGWLDEICWLPGLRLPQCPRVTKVTFWNRDRPESHRFLPRGHLLSQLCPSLIEFTCHGPLKRENWDESGLDLVPSVKDVNIDYSCDSFFVQKLGMLFPNVCRFVARISNVNECPGIIRGIWVWVDSVKEISLHVDCGQREDKLYRKMDAAITGMSEDICEELMNNSKHVTNSDAANLRTTRSIVDAKCLKWFQIATNEKEGNFERTPIFTQVSGIYGFGPMRENFGLVVKLSATSHCPGIEYDALGLLAPYAAQ